MTGLLRLEPADPDPGLLSRPLFTGLRDLLRDRF